MSVTDAEPVPMATEERGAVLPLFAIILVVLMGAAGMAVDLGWLYFKSIEIQHGADIAALSGVVYEPTQRAEAHTEAIAAAMENGFVDASLGGPDVVLIEDFIDNPAAVEDNSQLRATITHTVPTFFMKVFGIDDLSITRTAVAQYIQPLAMGSPDNAFGNDPATGYDPGLWASVHGTFGPQGWGDRYAALCVGTETAPGMFTSGCAQTPEGRPSVSPGSSSATGGYLYGIEVATGASGLTVEIFDGPYYHYEDEVLIGNSSLYWTGDYGDPFLSDPMATTWFMLYGPDATPLDTTDGNELLCTVRYQARDSRGEDYAWWDPSWLAFDEIDPSLLAQMWDSMGTSADKMACPGNFDRGPGIYPLRVMVENDDSWWVTNKYSLRVRTTAGPSPNIYGLGDMSIYTNVDAGTSQFYLAKVEDRYAGKTLIVELWDPGDVAAGGGGAGDTMTISSGNGSSLSCTWTASGGAGASSCTVDVSANVYDNELITITIPIPDDYICSGDACWFRATYQYTGTGVHDTTTWSAYIAGNPIRLVK